MDKANVGRGCFDDQPGHLVEQRHGGARRARECNEFGAKMGKDFPGRFGMFAALPLPDVEGA